MFGNPRLLDFVVLLCAVIAGILLYYRRKTLPQLRGPTGWPLVGNAFELPTKKHWLTYDRWAKQYGDVYQLTSFGGRTVILSSARAVHDLFEKRGAIYSDRPPAPMAGQLVGWNRGLGYARLTPKPLSTPSPEDAHPLHSPVRFRTLRRLFADTIGPRACATPGARSLQEDARRALLSRLAHAALAAPDGADFAEDIRQASGAFVLRLAYGYVVPHDVGAGTDKMVQLVEDAMSGFSRASEPGAFWVDRWPLLQYVPAWMPGAGFQHEAARLSATRERLYAEPYRWAERQHRAGTALPSMVGALLQDEADEELIMAAAASLYSGGAETTYATLTTLLLAMALNPAAQARAHAELDALEHAPIPEDRARLPYIDALLKELWRWQPSVPLGLAHRAAASDVYRGMEIAEGTVVYANIWSILHDEETFPEPEAFRPERFLDAQGRLRELERLEDPSVLAFGLGRRMCPGAHLADAAIFAYVAVVLHAFCVEKAHDEKGKTIEPHVEYDGFISLPKPFVCRLVPRRDLSEFM